MKCKQRGVALVLVLWVISLLAVIAGNFAYSMRGESQITRNLVSKAQAKALADAGIQRAWYELLRPSTDPMRWKADGNPHDVQFQGGAVVVLVQDESGKIDINNASDALLKGLFKSVGLGDDASEALADAIVDWRDPDTSRRPHGAEESEYRVAGKSYVPTNASFETNSELQRVLGMTPELYRAVAPSVTVYSKAAGFDIKTAPRSVLLAIPGVTAAMIDQFLEQKSTASGAEQGLPSWAAGVVSGGGGNTVYMVRSTATMPDGVTFVRWSVARMTSDPRRPVVVLAWGEGDTE